jgi:hypothetical protein
MSCIDSGKVHDTRSASRQKCPPEQMKDAWQYGSPNDFFSDLAEASKNLKTDSCLSPFR